MDKIFNANPNLKAYFATSDGQAFYTQNSAANHARTLKNKTITHHERSATDSEKLLFDQLSEMTVAELKAYAQENGLTVTKTRKSEVLEEITDQITADDDQQSKGESTNLNTPL